MCSALKTETPFIAHHGRCTYECMCTVYYIVSIEHISHLVRHNEPLYVQNVLDPLAFAIDVAVVVFACSSFLISTDTVDFVAPRLMFAHFNVL